MLEDDDDVELEEDEDDDNPLSNEDCDDILEGVDGNDVSLELLLYSEEEWSISIIESCLLLLSLTMCLIMATRDKTIVAKSLSSSI